MCAPRTSPRMPLVRRPRRGRGRRAERPHPELPVDGRQPRRRTKALPPGVPRPASVTGPSRQFDTRSEPILPRCTPCPRTISTCRWRRRTTSPSGDVRRCCRRAGRRLPRRAGRRRTRPDLGIGTGRSAVPLSRRSVAVHGIDLSAAMVARLRAKPGGDDIEVTIGDFATTRVDRTFRLAYLVFNTIMNLASQDKQVACFANAAAHLGPVRASLSRCWCPTSSGCRAARLRRVRHRQAGARLPPLPARRGPAGTLVGPVPSR
jgi:hypothetical protein